jgi:protein ImuB
MPVTDARTIHPALEVEPADREGDVDALTRLALWCQRYSPFTRIDEPDGISLDITGCAHLFGGEEALMADLAQRLEAFGLSAGLAVAPTLGAAWAAARHDESGRTIIAAASISLILAPYPISGLRLEDETIAALEKLGLKQVGLLFGKPRGPLVARFGAGLVLRLDQALGHADESFASLTPPPVYRAECRFAEPITLLADIEATVRHLSRELVEALYKAGKGARRIELVLFRVDGWYEVLELRTSTLSRDATHLSRLICERLERIEDNAGFGFEAATLSAFDVEKGDPLQHALRTGMGDKIQDIAPLLDRFVNRFGASNVSRFVPRASYVPERAVEPASVLDVAAPQGWTAHTRALLDNTPFARPALLFANPEPVNVLFETPDHPPVRFEWRRIVHRIVRADGPERLSPEWWRDPKSQTRDYYRVEDEAGHRYWLYRQGFHERPQAPSWFIHGLLP